MMMMMIVIVMKLLFSPIFLHEIVSHTLATSEGLETLLK